MIVDILDAVSWPAALVFLVMAFQKEIKAVIGRMKRADLPGGISFETFPEEIEAAKALSEAVVAERSQRPVPVATSSQVNERMIGLGFAPSPSGLDLEYYKKIADRDPRLALAGLRIELDLMLRNLAKGFKVDVRPSDGAGRLARRLHEAEAITPRQYKFIISVLDIANRAVHGAPVTTAQADEVLQIASVLADDYRAWLVWGFRDRTGADGDL